MAAEDLTGYGRGLHELLGASQVIPGTSAYSWNMAPDVTLTEDADVLAAGHERWGRHERLNVHGVGHAACRAR